MKNQHIYLRFLTLLHAIEGKGEIPTLDLDAKKLLEVIAVQHSQGQPLTVTDAMALAHVASPATIHRKLDLLRSEFEAIGFHHKDLEFHCSFSGGVSDSGSSDNIDLLIEKADMALYRAKSHGRNQIFGSRQE